VPREEVFLSGGEGGRSAWGNLLTGGEAPEKWFLDLEKRKKKKVKKVQVLMVLHLKEVQPQEEPSPSGG